MENKEDLLAAIVKKMLILVGLAEYATLVVPGTTNFAIIPATAARELASKMKSTYTVSHGVATSGNAWQKKLTHGPFAVKLYVKSGTHWDITIVTTGILHWVDMVMFVLRLPFWGTLNLRNARYAAHLNK